MQRFIMQLSVPASAGQKVQQSALRALLSQRSCQFAGQELPSGVNFMSAISASAGSMFLGRGSHTRNLLRSLA